MDFPEFPCHLLGHHKLGAYMLKTIYLVNIYSGIFKSNYVKKMSILRVHI